MLVNLASHHNFTKTLTQQFYSKLKFSHELSCDKPQHHWTSKMSTLKCFKLISKVSHMFSKDSRSCVHTYIHALSIHPHAGLCTDTDTHTHTHTHTFLTGVDCCSPHQSYSSYPYLPILLHSVTICHTMSLFCTNLFVFL